MAKKNKKSDLKVYVVKKYVRATSIAEAIAKEKKAPVDDCFVDEAWRKNQDQLASAIGFHVPDPEW